MKNQNEIEKEVNRIMDGNINKVKIILDRSKYSCFSKEYLEDLIRYGFISGKASKQKDVLKIIDEIGERFYYHSDIEGVSLKLNELEEYQEFKEEVRKRLEI